MIDDDPGQFDVIRLFFDETWKLTYRADGNDLLSGKLRLTDFDVLFLDLVLADPEINITRPRPPDPTPGQKILNWVVNQNSKFPIVVISAALDTAMSKMLESIGPNILCVSKPADLSKEEFGVRVEKLVNSLRAS
jgi:hypothetical protein